MNNTAQDLAQKAQEIAKSNPDILKKAQEMTGMNHNQDSSSDQNTMPKDNLKEDALTNQPITSLDEILDKSDNPTVKSNSNEGVMHEKYPELADDEEVVE
jgi:hypothetical protein